MTTVSGGISSASSDRSISGRRPDVAMPCGTRAPVKGGQELDGTGQRPSLRQDLAEDLAVPALERLCLV
jgi:hypothetical protein